MDDTFLGAWTLAEKAIKEECKIEGPQKLLECENWFDLKYITHEEPKTPDAPHIIKVSTSSGFSWKTLKERGYIDRITSRLKSATKLDNIELVPHYEQDELDFGLDARPILNNIKIDNTEPNPLPQRHFRANTTLYDEYTFDNFITSEGSSTDYAYKMALAVAAKPGDLANPILFYGGVGLGKTHLMNAIGNYIIQNATEPKKVCYTQSESFLNEFTSSLFQQKNASVFKNKYRRLDVLLLDDIQFLQGKEGIQQELFYIFEELYKNHKQMVFASDRPLSEIAQMEERLVSRLSGTCLDLQPPDFETRCAIIGKTLEAKDLVVPMEVIHSIAQKEASNVRALKGAVTKVIGYAQVMHTPITVQVVEKLLGKTGENVDNGRISILDIIEETAKLFKITSADLKAKKRDKTRALARQVAMFLGKELTDLTLTDIGRELGGRDHTTVMHGIDKITTEIISNPDLTNTLDAIRRAIKSKK